MAPTCRTTAASLDFFTVSSPINILNAPRPAPVSLRHVIGHLVPDLVLGALAKALPGQILAEGAASLWNIHISVRPGGGSRGTARRGADVQLRRHGRAAVAPMVSRRPPFPPASTPCRSKRPSRPGRSSSGARNCDRIPAATASSAAASDSISKSRPRRATSSISPLCLIACNHPAHGRDGGGEGAPGAVRLDDGTRLLGRKGGSTSGRPAAACSICRAAADMATPRARSEDARREDRVRGYVSEPRR